MKLKIGESVYWDYAAGGYGSSHVAEGVVVSFDEETVVVWALDVVSLEGGYHEVPPHLRWLGVDMVREGYNG